MKRNRRGTGLLFLMGMMLSGCVVGQSIRMDHVAQQPVSDPAHGPIRVAVQDNREFVVSGHKDPSYIGHYRASLGNVWDVKTKSGEPLARLLERDLLEELQSLGFEIALSKPFKKTLQVSIKDWNFDTYINGKFWYHLMITVLDRENHILAESQLKDRVVVKGSVWVGAKYAFEKELPKIYSQIITKIVRENPKILTALQE